MSSHEKNKLENSGAEIKTKTPASTVKLGKIKLAFLYILVGGLAASGLIAIIAILVGEFNSALQNAFATIFTFVLHSLFILGLIWSDRNDTIGRKIIPTTILATALASIATTTLGIWEIISSETSGRAFMFYALLIGTAFIVSGALKLIVNHKATKAILYSGIGSIVAWSLMLTPWIFEIVEKFNPLYFRIVGALTILSVTLFIVGLIIRSIAVSKSPEIRQNASQNQGSMSGGMLSYYIVVGFIVSLIWFSGMIAFIIDSINHTSSPSPRDNYSIDG